MADRTQPPKGASDGSTDPDVCDTSRRSFLGAAAALSALPAVGGTVTASSEERDESGIGPDVSVTSDDHGSRLADIENGDPVEAHVELPNLTDVETRFSVFGQAFDDEEAGHVEAHIYARGVSLSVEFTPERAHRLAEEFRLAAEFAEATGDSQ